MNAKVNFTTPVGRMVAGSFTKPNTTDAEGHPLVFKTGPDAGKPRVEFYAALAIPKGPEAAQGALGWMSTEWGQKLRGVGESFLSHAAQLPAFAWKVKDGDSVIPNKKGKRPCDLEGHAGHWVLSCSNGFLPGTYSLVGAPAGQQPPAVAPEALSLGHYMQFNITSEANGSTSQPGIYLNLQMACLVGYGTPIVVGPDVASAGFGGAPLPAGASMTPPAGFNPPPASVPVPTPAATVAVPPVVAPAPVMAPPPIVPNPAIRQVPVPPAAAPVRQMTEKAGGATYEQLIGAGWTDATLVQHGLMLA